MVFCYYKIKSKFLKAVIIKFVLMLIALVFVNIFCAHKVKASDVLWPSPENEIFFYDENIKLDDYIPANATSSNSRKGFLFTGHPEEIFDLGAGNIAVNVTLSGKSHTFLNFLKGLKERGIKITAILVNDMKTNSILDDVPEDFKNPYFYMIDFFNPLSGKRQLDCFNKVLEDFGNVVDNWVIGNEVNSQLYNFYGESDIEEYTKVYCDSFKIMYDMIKYVNSDANVFISFDQAWNLPSQKIDSKGNIVNNYNKYRYNAKEQLKYINGFLGKEVDWGVALHPYPAPLESAKFWDDEYAGFDYKAKREKDRPYLLTAKNFEIVFDVLKQKEYRNDKDEMRKVIISEVAFTSFDGEELQAAGLYYIWKKVEKYTNIIAFLYNAQTDLVDGYKFGLMADTGRRRLIWTVFRDMDDKKRSRWCQDLLDRILEGHDYREEDGVLYKIHSDEDNIKLINEFYDEYIKEYEVGDKATLGERLYAVKEKYMTKELIDFLDLRQVNENIDPVIMATHIRDFRENMLVYDTKEFDEVEVQVIVKNDIYQEVRIMKAHIDNFDGKRLIDKFDSVEVMMENQVIEKQ